MRKILKILPLAALALAACSSMEAEGDAELYGNMLPPDFNLAEFSKVNPDIAAMQARDTIVLISNAWEAELRSGGFNASQVNAEKKNDDLAFLTGDGLGIAKKYFGWSDEYIEETINTGASTLCAAPTTNQTRTPQNYLCQLNIYGLQNEMAFLDNFLASGKVDSSLIVRTYTAYGRKEGRPYRKCKPSEIVNAERSANASTYSALFFCLDDNGRVRIASDFGKN
jgi:hypothetical protein